jgi:sugar phosphate isomerase/epimerase
MQIQSHDLGVCSWSLHPKDMADLVGQVKQLGLSHMQLAVVPIAMLDDKRKHFELGQLRSSGIQLTATMMHFPGEDYSSIAKIRETGGYLPDKDWPVRKGLTEAAAALSAELGAKLVLTHVGFVPHKGQSGYDTMLGRVREVAEILSKRGGLTLIMETGQERAGELLGFMEDLKAPNVAINFDPANMILYGAGDPIEAIKTLSRHIRHVHVKDARASGKPGVDWGEEVPFGTGQVGPKRFLDALHSVGYRGALAIEREAGTQRLADVKAAIEVLKELG